jgi:hypothetical protein
VKECLQQGLQTKSLFKTVFTTAATGYQSISPLLLHIGHGHWTYAHAYVGCCCVCVACRSGNREIIDLRQGLFGTASTAAADPKAISRRKAHGALMAVNFIVILPLGALAARQLRCHWITSARVRASMFYVHMIAQVRNRRGYQGLRARGGRGTGACLHGSCCVTGLQ